MLQTAIVGYFTLLTLNLYRRDALPAIQLTVKALKAIAAVVVIIMHLFVVTFCFIQLLNYSVIISVVDVPYLSCILCHTGNTGSLFFCTLLVEMRVYVSP